MMPPVLPPLTGSPKQITWAADLRNEALAESDVGVDGPKVLALLAEKTDASYWIGNRMPMSSRISRRRSALAALAVVYAPPDRGPRVTETDRWTETWRARVEDKTLVIDEWERVYKRDDDLHVVVRWWRPQFGRGRPTSYSVTVSRDGKHIGSRHFAENVWWGHGGGPEGFVRQILEGSPPHWGGH